MKIRCLTLDDEPLALKMISAFVEQTPFLELVAQFDNAIDALNYLHSNQVELLLLDIQMADLTGMELARLLSEKDQKNKPYIIFTTAYSQFALEGYRVNAVEYLLKPFDYKDFLAAATKVRHRLEEQSDSEENSPPENPSFIFVKADAQIIRVEIDDILYIEGYKDYIKIYLSSSASPLLSLISLKKLEGKLSGTGFLRIHRSYIISFARVDALLKNSVRIGKNNIPVGSTYKKEYDQFVDQWLK